MLAYRSGDNAGNQVGQHFREKVDMLKIFRRNEQAFQDGTGNIVPVGISVCRLKIQTDVLVFLISPNDNIGVKLLQNHIAGVNQVKKIPPLQV